MWGLKGKNALEANDCSVAGDSRQRTAAAFTLLETLVAVTIIAIVLLAVYRLQSQTLVMNLSSRFYTNAPLLAQKKLSELELGGSLDLVDPSGGFGEGFPGYSWEAAVDSIDSELLGETAARLRRIDLKVLYNQGELEYTVRTYRLVTE